MRPVLQEGANPHDHSFAKTRFKVSHWLRMEGRAYYAIIIHQNKGLEELCFVTLLSFLPLKNETTKKSKLYQHLLAEKLSRVG